MMRWFFLPIIIGAFFAGLSSGADEETRDLQSEDGHGWGDNGKYWLYRKCVWNYSIRKDCRAQCVSFSSIAKLRVNYNVPII